MTIATQNKINLKIEKPEKGFICIDAMDNDTVSAVLTRLVADYKISAKLSLVFKFRELAPSRTLKSYLIGADSKRNFLSLQNFDKRNELKKIEEETQHFWEVQKVFEENADDCSVETKNKYFVTFPFPYMNGLLHCGHGFSLSKAEFAAGFQRLKGKKVLFPFGFHCTGMPIVASANRLKAEIEKFGNPPVFPVAEEKYEIENEKKAAESGKKMKKKGKLTKKASKCLYQFEIMRELGIPEDEISQFSDPLKWITHFTPQCTAHLRRFGAKIDFRRSFVTTDLNPFFTRFVEWQFAILKRKDLVRFGKRMCVYSPAENQPCADHDRSAGEGVLPQEYTAVELPLVADFREARAAAPARDLKWAEELSAQARVVLVAGTLRPETMYGQTNCFVKPNGDYVVVRTAREDTLFVCSEASARNMAFQGLARERGRVDVVRRLKGWDLLGLKVEAPNSVHGEVYVLPLLNIDMDKATAIVTSVPSDSPDDFINLAEIQKNAEFRQKYFISDAMVRHGPVAIIHVPGLGDAAAASAVAKHKVRSSADEKRLKEAKAEVYLKGFYKGRLLVGPYKGQTVETAKEAIRNELLAEGKAFRYFEPAEVVRSRSNEVCVVAETNQWFLRYGEEPAKEAVRKHIERGMDFFSENTRSGFLETVDWMRQWACSRKFGLGSKLPFDREWLIESLSDSTIYMAYYTISHYFAQGLSISDSDARLSGIEASDLSDEVLNAVFLGTEYGDGNGSKIPETVVREMRKEFEYWYPMDLRVSGKDLINNHLVMCLYNHAFVWPDQSLWPRAMFANGHALINAEKMSKSTGNFMTLIECIEQYGADATRLTFADAGDGLDDANFAHETCNAAIIKLTKELHWIKKAWAELRNGEKDRFREEKTFPDLIFENEINLAVIGATEAYDAMKFRLALNKGFYALCTARAAYVANCENRLKAETVEKYIETIIIITAPICSHWSEHLWRFVGHEQSVFRMGAWPDVDKKDIDHVLLRKSKFLNDTSHSVRLALADCKIKDGVKINIVYTEEISPVRRDVIRQILSFFSMDEKTFNNDAISGVIQSDALFADFSENIRTAVRNKFKNAKKSLNEAMMILAFVLKNLKDNGAEALEQKMPFSQRDFLLAHEALILKEISGFATLAVHDAAELPPEAREALAKSRALGKIAPGAVAVYVGP